MACVSFCSGFALPAAHAQHEDVIFGQQNQQIVLDLDGRNPVWSALLLTPTFPPSAGPPPVQQDNPGFNALAGAFSPGGLIGIRVVQQLWYWDGMELATPPDGTVFDLEHPLTGEFVTVDPQGPPAPDAAEVAIAEISEEGGLHQHIEFHLPDPVSPDGAYGVIASLTIDDPLIEDSDPFLLAFNQRLPNAEFHLGVEAILEASGILAQDLLPGDYNNNGQVEQADLDLVLLHWGDDAATPPENWTGVPPEGTIDQNELDGVLLHWGDTVAAANGVASVPEPGSMGLFLGAIGLLAIGIAAERSRSAVSSTV